MLGPIALALATLLVAAPDPSTSASNPDQVTVELLKKKKLRLKRWTTGRRDPGQVGLDGVLIARIQNGTKKTVRLVDPEVHGLVFRDAKTGEETIVSHSCQCAKEHHDGPRIFVLHPGEKRDLVLSDFGCGGGMWKPPAKGLYKVSYRLLPLELHEARRPKIKEKGMTKVIEACRQSLRSEARWKGSYESAALDVKLGKPKKVRIR